MCSGREIFIKRKDGEKDCKNRMRGGKKGKEGTALITVRKGKFGQQFY